MAAPIIGRARERAALDDALDAALSGRGAVVLLAGEAGIGKSTLAEDIAGRAAGKGARVVWGRAWEEGGAPAFWPWIQVVRFLLRASDIAPAIASAGSRISPLAELVPELRDAGIAPAEAQPDPSQARFRLLEAAAAFLATVADREKALVVVLEDLHVADRSSLLLLDFVARSHAGLRLLIVGTFREVEARLGEAGDALAKVQRSARTLSLARFGEQDIAELEARHPSVPPETIAGALRTSEGNPLFLSEILRVTRDSSGGLPVRTPDGIGAVIRAHLSFLSPGARGVLEAASVIGREVAAASLRDSGFEPLAVEEALAEAVRAGIVHETEPGRHRFTHVLLREEMLRAIPPAKLQALHRARAEALVRRHEVDPQGAPASEIAHHFDGAGAASRDLAVRWYQVTGERALAQYAFDEAAAAFARALALDPEETPARRVERLLQLARARIVAGQSDEGRRACLEAADIARRLESAELFARAILEYGSVYMPGYRNELLASLLEEAIERLGPADHPLHARALARMAAALQPAPDGADGPVRIASRAIEMARRIGDAQTRLDVFTGAMSAMMDMVDAEERIGINREHLALARETRDLLQEHRAHVRLVLDQFELGDFGAALETVRGLEAVTLRLGSRPAQRWPSLFFRAALHVASGRFDEAERLYAEAEALGDATGITMPSRTAFVARLGAARTRTHSEGLVGMTSGLREWWSHIPAGERYGEMFVSLALHWAGQPTVFPAEFGSKKSLQFFDDSMATYFLAEVSVALGDRDRVLQLLPLVERRSERWSSWGFVGMSIYAPFAQVHGLALAMLDRWAEAEERFARALRLADDPGFAPIAARLRVEQADALRASGRDETLVIALLARARPEAERLAMTGLLRQIEALEAKAPIDRARRSVAAVPSAAGFRMSIEGDLWSIEADGKTVRLKDSRGLRMLSRLAGEPGRDFHALDLDGAGDGTDAGDAGELLDEKSKLAYKRRVQELREEIAEAEEWNDPGRAALAREELDALQAELSRAIGLGGRSRRAGAAAERARVNVQRRLKDAIRRIGDVHPGLGKHLAWAVKTGVLCSYSP